MSTTNKAIDATAAGTTNIDSHLKVVDMEGFDGVLFIASIGALTATQVTSLTAQGSTLSDGSDATDLKGTASGNMADADSNKLLILDLYQPQFRYISVTVKRATANAVINCVIAIQYQGRLAPITQPATVSKSKIVVAAVAGTP